MAAEAKEDPNVMKAVRCLALGDVLKCCKLEEKADIPTIKKKGELLVKVYYAALNPIDWKLISGKVMIMKQNPPCTPGKDFCGCIVEAHESVAASDFKVGDVIFGTTSGSDGSFAEYMIVPTTAACKIPSTISPMEAAGLSLASNTSYQSLLKAGLQSGQTLLILGGTTSCGMSAIQIAKNAIGASNVTVTSSQEELCKSLGADRVINYKKETWFEELKDAKFDVIFDCVGGRESWDKAQSESVIKETGHYVTVVGDLVPGHGPVGEIGTADAIKTVGGLLNRKFWGAIGQAVKYDLVLLDTNKHLSHVAQLVQDNKLKVLLDKESPFKFEDFDKMFQKSITGKARGKLILEVCPVPVVDKEKEDGVVAADEPVVAEEPAKVDADEPAKEEEAAVDGNAADVPSGDADSEQKAKDKE